MNRQQRLNKNLSSIEATQKELARIGRGLGTARLALPRTEKAVRVFEDQAADLRSDLETLITERLKMRKEVVERPLSVRSTTVAKRECLTELIEDIRRYCFSADFSPQFREETNRMLSEAILTRADIARQLGVKIKRKSLNLEWHWVIDDIVEAKFLIYKDKSPRDLAFVSHVATDIFEDLGLLRTDVSKSKVREILWTIMKGIVGAAAGSGALALYHMLSNLDVTGQQKAAAKVYEAAWSANKESIEKASSLFAEQIEPREIFKLLSRFSRPL